ATTLYRYIQSAKITLPTDNAKIDKFSDEKDFPQYAKAPIEALRKAGIYAGKDEGRFGYNDPLNRAEAYTTIINFLEIVEGNTDKPENPQTEPLKYEKKTVSTGYGNVTADIITVDMSSPKVRVEAKLVNNTVGQTAKFSDIIAASSAKAIVCSNFFESNAAFKAPIGHVMTDGQFRYGSTGVPAFGFTNDNKIKVGKPAMFFRVYNTANKAEQWPTYELNTAAQTYYNSITYTPSFGSSVKITGAGTIVVVENSVITAVRPAVIGEAAPIPSNGYILWLGEDYISTDYYRAPKTGTRVAFEPYLFKEDEEGFTLDGVTSLVSGGPRLVKDGAIVTELDPGFTGERFTTMVAPRTAIGVLPNGNLVIVSLAAASVNQMRGLMLALGCEDAINLDGGGSTAMYYNGATIRSPGRQLTTTLQVFVD
ncbi:phosphodiester glycosidase family protein, partial [Clostridiaceae bacterium OttesenSCG-928-D20]|nr:phosphodiester glycosidase family protein [Clostridiaceae bacterium OttesenSCG-928-D20]